MNKVLVYGLTQCSTCVKARQWLDVNTVAYEFVDYRAQPIAAALLTQFATQVGGWEKLCNRASMTWRQLSEEQKNATNDSDWLALIATYPALIRRPLLVRDGHVVAQGFNEKRLSAALL